MSHFFSGRPTPLGEVLEEYLKKKGFLPHLQAYFCLHRFGEWFPELSPFCHPVKFQKGVLYLKVSDPLRVLEVKQKLRSIEERLQKEGVTVEKVKIQCT